MRPILFSIFGLDIKSYGFFIAIGFLIGINLAAHFAKKEGENPEIIFDLSIYMLLAGIIGARLLEVAVNYKDYISNPLDILAIWRGGLTFYGGLIAALAVSVVYVKKKKIDYFKFADIVAPSLALGYMFGRIGCFFAGCCYGKPAIHGHFCVTFTNPQSFAPQGVCLYPTQLYEAVFALVILIILLVMRKYRSFKGQLFALFFLLYAPLRFVIEFIRNDTRGLYFDNRLSTSQLIGIPIFIGAFIFYFYLRKKNKIK